MEDKMIANKSMASMAALYEFIEPAPPTADDNTYYRTGDCREPTYQYFIAGYHSIRESVFDEMINRQIEHAKKEYDVDFNANGKEICISKIAEQVDDEDCRSLKIIITTLRANVIDNSDISLTPPTIYSTTMHRQSYYSITLFKGLLDILKDEEIEKFVFYKARKENYDLDVVFKIIDKAGNIRYYGDISGLP
jgi:hypothetical protein